MITRRQFLAGAIAGTGALALGRMELPPVAEATPVPAHLGGFAETLKGQSYPAAFTQYQNEAGRGVDLYRTYRSWGQSVFNTTLDTILSPTKNPYPVPRIYISLHPFTGTKGTSGCIPWADITAGQHDDVLDSWAADLAKLDRPYIAFNHEMENEEGTPDGSACGTADDFRNAYWHVRQRIESHDGVSGARWVVTYMRNTFAPVLKHGGPAQWWPTPSDPAFNGTVADDALLGVDVYNRNVCHYKGWQTFHDLVNPTLVSRKKQALTCRRFAQGVGRRIFIGEMGCVEGDDCGGTLPHGTAKAKWFTDMLNEVKGWSDGLEAMCYSQVNGFNNGNYRIDTSSQAQAAFQTLAADPFFAHS